ncbi:MAG TPA: GAF domain-containing protein [Anaerolineaceae bacterium]|nr:GAF domain-containing protein [Anaerolineaceae bacterium]
MAVIYLILAVVLLVAIPFHASRWLSVPFPGFFTSPHLIVTMVSQPAVNGDLLGWQVAAVEGAPVSNSADLARALQSHLVDQSVSISLRSASGVETIRQVSLRPFPETSRFTYLYFPYCVGLIYFLAALWIFILRGRSPSGQVFTLFTSSVAIVTAGLFDIFTTQQFVYLWSFSLALASGTLLHFGLLYPHRSYLLTRFPVLQLVPYFIAALLAPVAWISLATPASASEYLRSWRAEFLFAGLSVLLFLVHLLFQRSRSVSPLERERGLMIFLGALVSFGPVAAWFLAATFRPETSYTPYLTLSLAIFPVITAYTLQHRRQVRSDYIISRTLLYTTMTVLAGVGYALLVSGLGIIMVQTNPDRSALISGVIIFCLALLFNPLRLRAQNMVDAVFFRGEKALQERIRTFGHELTNAVGLPEIIAILRRYIQDALLPTRLHVFIYDPLSDQYVASLDESGKATSEIRFPVQSPLIQGLSQQQGPLFLESRTEIPAALNPDQPRLGLLAAQIFLPLPGQKRLAGFLALGPRQSGENYTSRDLTHLEALCDQAALAIERAQVVANMEHHVREMNVLSRVAQGVNVTLTFDDILELIYAQTNQLLPTRDFRMTLVDPVTGIFRHAFYLENDERLNEQENSPLASNQTLEQEVARTRKAILADDCTRECQKRGIVALYPGLYAWMGVPLNAGAETIGALSLGSRDSAVTYTFEQLNLLQAIADQTAGAIVKARLLQESERRALQLSTMNDVTRQLTSTLELEPLLQNILQNAVDILNCEAGSLLLVDEQTDELVFRVAVGPVASNLVGLRMAPGSGVVGKSVKNHQPIIVNNVQNTPDWFSKTDKQTGFSTQALLVNPLEVKDNVIGVIEVINKRDGLPFTNDDLSLLSAFAGQAAVAIENARLYTLTDQALAERVEELSVMQRIDRELNTSLDVNLAMRITLEWAMRQSKTNAGLVGMLTDSGLRIMAFQGYTDELDAYQDSTLPSDAPYLEAALQSGQPQRIMLPVDSPEGSGLLLDARSQIVIPIRREATTMGLLLLESTLSEPVSEDTLAFLARLSDHAAIAIANAQLYAAVQAANVAKSEFVSFVSHELKNPMTSIKGYTELLAAGAVGPINEAQANFLGTIRSNVERMSTLVSDLADVSRIEAGRLRLEFKALSMVELSDEVIRSSKRQLEDKNHTLEMQIPKDLPLVWADRTRLIQVLTNLVSNAIKYTSNGGKILVGAEASPNRWDASGARQVVHIWVADTGIGIAPEDQKKIFQKFFRSEDPKTREAPGTGLGLNITKSLVEMQGGQIWFESEFRKGTTFNFTIPVSE